MKDKEWKGYTLGELQTRRLIVATRIEIEKARLQAMGAGGGGDRTSAMYTRLSGWIDYLQYGVQAYRLARRLASWLRSLRRS